MAWMLQSGKGVFADAILDAFRLRGVSMSSRWPLLDTSRYPGIVLCAVWCGLLGAALLAWALVHLASLPLVSLIVAGGFLYAARGLLKGRKPGWHIAAFLAFATLVTRGVAVACTPGEIAAGEAGLLDALDRKSVV